MKKIVFLLTCLFLFGCASGQQPQPTSESITFETGKSRKIVMQTIIEVVNGDGYKVAYANENEGIIRCKPREMLNGVLKEKTNGTPWKLQFQSETLNSQIRFSANVNPDGIVKLKTLVMATNSPDSLYPQKSEKLARYYENKIKEALRRVVPRLI
ncbi:MAG: hypothetical protein K9N10_06640 [Deltaproteobacteria bacterium]|nr:hypothetical protein [Deltaproteobacteria bacterium]